MLRKLRLTAELKKRAAALKALQDQKAGFNKRQTELETALKEAETEEDIELVNKNVDELDEEIKAADVDNKIAAEQAEIDKVNAELETIAEPAGSEAGAGTQEPPAGTTEERGAKAMKKINRRGIFYTLDVQERQAFLESEKVRSFLGEIKELKTRGVNNAEVTIPDEFIDVIRPNLPTLSKLYSKMNVKPVKGKARKNIAGTYPEAVWTEMCGALNELDITFNQITVDGYKVGGFICIDNDILMDSEEQLASEILTALAAAIAKAIDRGAIFGTGNKMPLGIASRLAQTAKPADWDTKGPDWTDLHETHIVKFNSTEAATTGATFFATLYDKLTIAKSDYATGELTWVMNKKTHKKLIAKSIAFDAAAAIVAAVNNTMPVIGGEIIEIEAMADDDILGGYFDLYVMAERQGGNFALSEYTKFVEEQTIFKGSARYDGKPVFGEAFVIVNINNTNPTTVSTFPGDGANVKRVSLKSLKIGATAVTLFPPFDPAVLNYHCKVTAHSQKITAEVLTDGATATIKNGSTAVTSGGNATFTAGENKLTVEVTNGNATKRTYTVVVEDETA